MNHLSNQASDLDTRLAASNAALNTANAEIAYRLAYRALREAMRSGAVVEELESLREAVESAVVVKEDAYETMRLACVEVATDIFYS